MLIVYLTPNPETYGAHDCDAARDENQDVVSNYREGVETPAPAVTIIA